MTAFITLDQHVVYKLLMVKILRYNTTVKEISCDIALSYCQQFIVHSFHAVVFSRRLLKYIATMVRGFLKCACVIASPQSARSRVHSVEQRLHWSRAGGRLDRVFFIASLITTRKYSEICGTHKKYMSVKPGA